MDRACSSFMFVCCVFLCLRVCVCGVWTSQPNDQPTKQPINQTPPSFLARAECAKRSNKLPRGATASSPPISFVWEWGRDEALRMRSVDLGGTTTFPMMRPVGQHHQGRVHIPFTGKRARTKGGARQLHAARRTLQRAPSPNVL